MLIRPPDLEIFTVHAKEYDRIALMLNNRSENPATVGSLLKYLKVGVNTQDSYAMTAFFLPAREGPYKTVECLFKRPGINVSTVDS